MTILQPLEKLFLPLVFPVGKGRSALLPKPSPARQLVRRVRVDIDAGTYLSADEVERDETRSLGYLHVPQHPREVAPLVRGQLLVVDFNVILFADKPAD